MANGGRIASIPSMVHVRSALDQRSSIVMAHAPRACRVRAPAPRVLGFCPWYPGALSWRPRRRRPRRPWRPRRPGALAPCPGALSWRPRRRRPRRPGALAPCPGAPAPCPGALAPCPGALGASGALGALAPWLPALAPGPPPWPPAPAPSSRRPGLGPLRCTVGAGRWECRWTWAKGARARGRVARGAARCVTISDQGANHRILRPASTAGERRRLGRDHSPPGDGTGSLIQPAALSDVPGSSSWIYVHMSVAPIARRPALGRFNF
jgi:hypothetical protein